ncbi:MAG TPA: hypothetical protein VMW52_02685, partial [Phycisphaerae bacterium]|nr:hypothetical protein [Phycisphaerae bacterium]
DGDTPAAAAERLHRVGALDVAPFPMFYRPPLRTRRPMPPEWHDLVGRALRQPWASRMWSRRMAIERSN